MEEELNNAAVDISEKELIPLAEVAKILGLKYHTARKLLFGTIPIGHVDFGCKKLWVKDEVLAYKASCYVPHSAL